MGIVDSVSETLPALQQLHHHISRQSRRHLATTLAAHSVHDQKQPIPAIGI
ncbi:hypothetical protein RF55_25683, partial [Lasius niger]